MVAKTPQGIPQSSCPTSSTGRLGEKNDMKMKPTMATSDASKTFLYPNLCEKYPFANAPIIVPTLTALLRPVCHCTLKLVIFSAEVVRLYVRPQ